MWQLGEDMSPQRKAFIDRLADALIGIGERNTPERRMARAERGEGLANIGCGLWIFAVGVLAPLSRYFHRTGGLDGPVGVAVSIGIAIAVIAFVGFVLGWAFRKGWRAGDTR